MPCWRTTTAKIPAGEYRVLAALNVGMSPEIQTLLQAKAEHITLTKGMHATLKVKTWTPEEIIQLALDSL
jgi:hypothetical protein